MLTFETGFWLRNNHLNLYVIRIIDISNIIFPYKKYISSFREDSNGHFQTRFLLVNVEDFLRNTIVVQDNR